ncbi:putative ribonuclease P complex subunit Pop2 [Zopfia rhizophila CBS 207.26]|uniref:Putative ribonuclease P complex subunit Pop2 n=1 Tax=Zopfia rhizophila CBS 207.26 TaxID=1314779 RepID=A0A6A6EB09_9PEZI|nr:putative ribonuclease P complex subunit Pop2 [Zopfia rhizophila CBS 207.26]
MFYDLNVPWTDNNRELQRTIAFLDELGYDVVALTHTISGKLPADLTSPVPLPLPFSTPSRLRLLRRCNIFLNDAATNHRIPQLQQQYDILAARPTDEKTLRQACDTLDIDLISLDLTQRFQKHFKYKMFSTALSRGVRIEICYSQGILASDTTAKRNLISNVVQLIRVTRGRGLVLSSEAKSVLGLRAPSDVINLASVWGLGQERGKEGLTKEARSVVEFSRLKRTSFKGVVDVIYGGEKPVDGSAGKNENNKQNKVKRANAEAQKKRKADSMEGTPLSQSGEDKPLSKREIKRKKQQARLEGQQKGN